MTTDLNTLATTARQQIFSAPAGQVAWAVRRWLDILVLRFQIENRR
ncbi:hypothetical protein [Larkinella ripae]